MMIAVRASNNSRARYIFPTDQVSSTPRFLPKWTSLVLRCPHIINDPRNGSSPSKCRTRSLCTMNEAGRLREPSSANRFRQSWNVLAAHALASIAPALYQAEIHHRLRYASRRCFIEPILENTPRHCCSHFSLQANRARSSLHSKILYFSVDGTWWTASRPSYDTDAKAHESLAPHATAYTESSCSS